MYRIPIYKIQLLRDGSVASERKQIRRPIEVVEIFQVVMKGLAQEALYTLTLDTKNNIIGLEQVYLGTLASIDVRVAEVFRLAIQQNAAAIIIAHNHPSGDPTPSSEDMYTTQSIIQGGEILGINVLDHLIIADENYLSLKEKGLGGF